jgi:flagellar assembly factor FliW
MIVKSLQLGEVEVSPEDVFTLNPPLMGLESYRQYALVRPDPTLPFAYLQSVEEPAVCLLVVDPFAFHRNYEFDLSEMDEEGLEYPQPHEVLVYVTVTLRESLEDATVNLLAPLIFNSARRIGRQIVLHDSPYSTKTPLFPK